MVTANAEGTEKLSMLFPGKSKTPRWIKEMPEEVSCYGTPKGLMTVLVYQQWLRKRNETIVSANRHIFLLLDNAPVHIEQEEPLSNTRVLKLPPNTTAGIQPTNQGVIANLKYGVVNSKTDAAVHRLLDGVEGSYSASLADAIK